MYFKEKPYQKYTIMFAIVVQYMREKRKNISLSSFLGMIIFVISIYIQMYMEAFQAVVTI